MTNIKEREKFENMQAADLERHKKETSDQKKILSDHQAEIYQF